jgi:hypothetical protein
MVLTERMAVIDKLPFELRVAFIAFCADRCLKEARLHPRAAKQLEGLPLLVRGLDMLWVTAEKGGQPAAQDIEAALGHLSSYDRSSANEQDVEYNYDVTLVDAANAVRNGLLKLKDPESATPRLVANALEAPYHTVSVIYSDYKKSRKAETDVIDAALIKLRDLGDQPFTRAVFDGIPDWPRGPVTKKYAEGRLKGTAEDDE